MARNLPVYTRTAGGGEASTTAAKLTVAGSLFFWTPSRAPSKTLLGNCFIAVTITSFKPGRSQTGSSLLSFCLSLICKTSSTQYKWNCVNVLLDCVFLLWLKVQHWKHSMMLTGSCYFPDDAHPPFVYCTACIRRVHRTRVHVVISTPLLINNNDRTLGFIGTFEKTPHEHNPVIRVRSHIRKYRRMIISNSAFIFSKKAIRYCDHCQLIKPDRCHHCSTCEMWVLYMLYNFSQWSKYV